LSSDEIIKATESIGVTVDVLQILKNCDIDKNGLVNYTEFLAATVNQQMFYNKQNLLKVFAAFDKNGDGKIDLEELKEVLGAGNTDASIKSMIDEADVNKDGVIDIEEFMNHMKAYAEKVCDDNC
jgi:calcium-dependent protein kinase